MVIIVRRLGLVGLDMLATGLALLAAVCLFAGVALGASLLVMPNWVPAFFLLSTVEILAALGLGQGAWVLHRYGRDRERMMRQVRP